MGLLGRLLGIRRGSGEDEAAVEIVSRKPVGTFAVRETFRVGSRMALTGVVESGMAMPGYKVRGKNGAAVIYRIERGRSAVDFVVDGDEAALILEGEFRVERGERLEIYAS
ncbi:MAG: translation factor [Thermococci archaeon]|nr:translation factor [Thermococci archaeon]